MNRIKYRTLYLEQQRAIVPSYVHFFPAEVSFIVDVSYVPDCDRVQTVPNWEESERPSEAERSCDWNAPWTAYGNLH